VKLYSTLYVCACADRVAMPADKSTTAIVMKRIARTRIGEIKN
jgi:hypothetical protein